MSNQQQTLDALNDYGHQGPLTSALHQADPARVVGNKSLGLPAVTHQIPGPLIDPGVASNTRHDR